MGNITTDGSVVESSELRPRRVVQCGRTSHACHGRASVICVVPYVLRRHLDDGVTPKLRPALALSLYFCAMHCCRGCSFLPQHHCSCEEACMRQYGWCSTSSYVILALRHRRRRQGAGEGHVPQKNWGKYFFGQIS